jgi:hypothetical protein
LWKGNILTILNLNKASVTESYEITAPDKVRMTPHEFKKPGADFCEPPTDAQAI